MRTPTSALLCLILSGSAGAAEPAANQEGPLPPKVFGVGAQTEFIGPITGASGALAAYDRGPIQLEVTLAGSIFELPSENDSQTDALSVGFRLFFPMHRAARADFSLGGGAGLVLFWKQETGLEPAVSLVAGGRARIFVAPNVAIFGTIGAGGVLRTGNSALLLGARPLGAAGFIYYFL